MKEAAIRKKLLQLSKVIADLRPPTDKTPKTEGLCLSNRPKDSLEESLDWLGLQVGYLLFDLEATRRENRYLLRMLETRPRSRGDEDNEGLQNF